MSRATIYHNLSMVTCINHKAFCLGCDGKLTDVLFKGGRFSEPLLYWEWHDGSVYWAKILRRGASIHSETGALVQRKASRRDPKVTWTSDRWSLTVSPSRCRRTYLQANGQRVMISFGANWSYSTTIVFRTGWKQSLPLLLGIAMTDDALWGQTLCNGVGQT